MKRATIQIEGMTCSSCGSHVKAELEKLKGKNINVNIVTNKATLDVEDSVSEGQLKTAVKDAGYMPVSISIE